MEETNKSGSVSRREKNAILARKMWRLAVQSYLMALVVLLLGAIFSLYYPEGLWFQRFGSIVVVIAIVQIIRWRIATYQAKKFLGWAVAAVTIGAALKRIRKKLDDSPEESAQKARQHAVDSFSHENEAIETAEIFLWLSEGVLLVVGTLVWGFGDLVV